MTLDSIVEGDGLAVRFDAALGNEAAELLLRPLEDLVAEGLLEPVHESRGARVLRGRLAAAGPTLYWKEFRRRRSADRLKDRLRASRAERAILGGERLAALGLGVPAVLAHGERSGPPSSRRSFLLTRAVEGFRSLEEADPGPRGRERVAGALVRLHAAGLVHGDLKPSNLLLEEHGDGLVLLDNERTRPSRLRRERVRNLVQLLIDPSPGMPAGERAGFLQRYGELRGLGEERTGRLIADVERWIAARERRRARRAGAR